MSYTWVSSVMSHNWFQTTLRNIHFVDNMTVLNKEKPLMDITTIVLQLTSKLQGQVSCWTIPSKQAP